MKPLNNSDKAKETRLREDHNDPLGPRLWGLSFLDLFYYTYAPWPRDREGRAARAATILTGLGILILAALFVSRLDADSRMPTWMASALWVALAAILLIVARYWLNRLRRRANVDSRAGAQDALHPRDADDAESLLDVVFHFLEVPTTVYESEDRKGPWLALFAVFMVVMIGLGALLFGAAMTTSQWWMLAGAVAIVAFLGWLDYAHWRKHRHNA